MTTCGQRSDEMLPDEAAAAGNENSHRHSPLFYWQRAPSSSTGAQPHDLFVHGQRIPRHTLPRKAPCVLQAACAQQTPEFQVTSYGNHAVSHGFDRLGVEEQSRLSRRYLRAKGKAFSVDEDRMEKEARYDGIWVLRTNTAVPTKDVALTYKRLWTVEEMFRSMKSLLTTRPI
jgi:hypothetical protein